MSVSTGPRHGSTATQRLSLEALQGELQAPSLMTHQHAHCQQE